MPHGADLVLFMKTPAGHETRAFRRGNAEFNARRTDRRGMGGGRFVFRWYGPVSSNPGVYGRTYPVCLG